MDSEKIMISNFNLFLEPEDYLKILKVAVPIVISKKAIGAYFLNKEYKPKNISKVILPPELTAQYNEVDTSKISTIQCSEAIEKFADVIIKNFPSEDLTNFYNNINNLKISTASELKKRFGYYTPNKNIIVVEENNIDLALFHELFHMASTTCQNGIIFTGFYQVYMRKGLNKVSIGNGLNEGYTELLSERYFLPSNSDISGYKYQVFIAKNLEQIIGREKMQSLYLNSNLMGLIEELKKYESEDEIMKFISNMDFVKLHLYDKKIQILKKYMLSSSLKNINKFLLTCYSRKLYQELNNGEISTDDMKKSLDKYIVSLAEYMRVGNNRYEIMTYEDTLNCLQYSFTNTDFNVSAAQNKKIDIKRKINS